MAGILNGLLGGGCGLGGSDGLLGGGLGILFLLFALSQGGGCDTENIIMLFLVLAIISGNCCGDQVECCNKC